MGKLLTKILRQLRDPLYQNSFFIMLSSITDAGFGFFFWVITAKFEGTNLVGKYF